MAVLTADEIITMIPVPMRPAIVALVEILDAEPRWLEAGWAAWQLSKQGEDPGPWKFVELELFDAVLRENPFALNEADRHSSEWRNCAIFVLGMGIAGSGKLGRSPRV